MEMLIACSDARLECPRLWKKVILIEGFLDEPFVRWKGRRREEMRRKTRHVFVSAVSEMVLKEKE